MYNNKMILAVVPARAGSKRVKNKNIKNLFKNKSLLDFTYKSASKSKYLDKIILSTDSEKIIKKAASIGFKNRHKRPKKFSTNKSPSEDALFHSIKKIKKKFDYLIMLQPTSPLRTSYDIDKSIEKIVDNNLESLMSISKINKKHKYNIDIINKKFISYNFITNIKKKFYYFLNGAIFLCKTSFFLKNKKTFIWQKKLKAGYYMMPYSRSLDIDTDSDIKKLIKILKKNVQFNN